jgi:hypothetical protein
MRTRQIFILFLLLATSTLWGQVKTTEATSLSRVVQDTMTVPKDTAMSPKERRQAKSGRIPTPRAIYPNSPLSRVDVRLGWSILSDDGTFLQNPLRFNNWENVTLRPLPASFSIHFPYYSKPNGAMGQIGLQSFYSASKAVWIAGEWNQGTAHYAGANVDFRSIFPTIRLDQARFNPFVNYGLGYTYRSVALYNHEPIVHFGGGITSWFTDRVGVTVSGTGNFGTLHFVDGFTSYLQGNVYFVFRI